MKFISLSDEPYPTPQYDFKELDTALGKIGYVDENRHLIYKILVGILFLGNIDFETIDNSCCIANTQEALINAAHFIGVDLDELEKGLLTRCIRVDKSTIEFVFVLQLNFE